MCTGDVGLVAALMWAAWVRGISVASQHWNGYGVLALRLNTGKKVAPRFEFWAETLMEMSREVALN